MRLKNLCYLSVSWLLLFCTSLAMADIYIYRDENGVQHFTNVPTDRCYKKYIQTGCFKPGCSDSRYEHCIREMSVKYNVDCDLVRAVIQTESGFNPLAVSKEGARGLMQLMPETARDMEVENAFYPRENIEGGVKYLRRLLDVFNNDLSLALAAYNAGENTVRQYNFQIPPYQETKDYVRKVIHYLKKYKAQP